MTILQKIFAVILLTIFTSFSTGVVNASINYIEKNDTYNFPSIQSILTKEVIIAKLELAKTKNGNKYISQIDKIINKIKNDKEKLQKLKSKLYEVEKKLYLKADQEVSFSKYKKYFALIKYLQAKVNLELYKLEQKEKEILEKKSASKIEEMLNPNISEADKKKVEEKLTKIQLALLNTAKGKFDSLTQEFTKLTNYEENGNFKFSFNFDHELVGKIKSEIKLQDYKAKNSGFDSQFTGKLKALVEASIKGEDKFKMELNTFLDFISKDGNMYVLLKDLNIINEGNDKKIKEMLETLKKIASKNKYIKFEDRDTKEVLEQLKNINPNKIFTQAKETLEKPLFTAYKKEGNKYYLIPTKYACDKYKEIIARFDPWNGNTCSEDQYKKMLKELAQNGDLYIELGTKNKLSFEAYPDKNDIKSFNSYVIFTDTSIEELHSELQNTKPGEGFELSYLKGNKLVLYLNAGKDLNIDFKSTLTRNNNFKSIDLKYNSKGYNDQTTATVKLENKKITGDIDYNYSSYAGYDYKTDRVKYEKYNTKITINGNQDYKYNLSNLKINLVSKNLDKNKNTFILNFDKKQNNYNLEMQGFKEGKTTFKSDIKLQNKSISGLTTIFDKSGKEYIKISSSGKYDTKYLKLDNKIQLAENITELLNNQGSKTRDMIRKSDLKSLQAALEQYYMDNSEYPSELKTNKEFETYAWYIPKDPLGNVEINNCKFGYFYEVGKDENGIENNSYRLSACMENEDKFEIGVYKEDFKADKAFYINGYKTWIKKENNNKDSSAEININIEVDTRYNKDNINYIINYIEGTKKVLEIEIDNKATIKYKKVDIKAPSDTIDLNEALDQKY